MRVYLDDSGTRHPDREQPKAVHEYNWFGIGGVIIREQDTAAVEARHDAFCASWKITSPLHSHEIRHRVKNFLWLSKLPQDELTRFYSELGALASSPEFTAIACVIDRPGYNHRYKARYGENRWLLCKTAFSVAVERAAKFADRAGARLRVYAERSDPETDAMLKGYYDQLRDRGHPFDEQRASKYSPLTAEALHTTLYDFKTKRKSSRIMQLADICLWPVCIGGYDPNNKPYVAMREAGVLIDCKLPPEALAVEGIKYSCWDLRQPKNQNPDSGSGS